MSSEVAASQSEAASLEVSSSILSPQTAGTTRRPPRRTTSSSSRTMSSSGHKQRSRRAPGRSLSSSSSGSRHKDTDDTRLLAKLKAEMSSLEIKHREDLYWLKLELDTTRREKEAVEDRMAELYRDLQELDEVKPRATRLVSGDDDFIKSMHQQLVKYEKMVRVLSNQIQLVRSSTDTVVKSLKEEISELMDEKSRSELSLMNKIAEVDKTNQELKTRLVIAEQNQRSQSSSRRPNLHTSPENNQELLSEDLKKLQDHIVKLELEDKAKAAKFVKEREEASQDIEKISNENRALKLELEQLQNEIVGIRSSATGAQVIRLAQNDREATKVLLERVALIWDRAEEFIQNLESTMTEFNSREEDYEGVDEYRCRVLSTLDTVSLVHGQVKVSLMLIELKLRNNLSGLRNERYESGADASTDEVFISRLDSIQSETMTEIEKVERLIDEQVEKIEAQAKSETQKVKEHLESRVNDLRQMETRQKELEEEISENHKDQRVQTGPRESSNCLTDSVVSRASLERLQTEVLQIVERLNEKNEYIGRLNATVEEHKVRERALMEELKRLREEQARIQMEERQRLIDAQAGGDDYSEVTGSEFEDGSSEEYAEGSIMEETVEEIVMEETVFEEIIEE